MTLVAGMALMEEGWGYVDEMMGRTGGQRKAGPEGPMPDVAIDSGHCL